ncbi:hypothetical protein J6590_104549 [Homalodisca vitripennis]|nr:hypothetical protein J6590_104549 [Homalodisca vitripennis]
MDIKNKSSNDKAKPFSKSGLIPHCSEGGDANLLGIKNSSQEGPQALRSLSYRRPPGTDRRRRLGRGRISQSNSGKIEEIMGCVKRIIRGVVDIAERVSGPGDVGTPERNGTRKAMVNQDILHVKQGFQERTEGLLNASPAPIEIRAVGALATPVGAPMPEGVMDFTKQSLWQLTRESP